VLYELANHACAVVRCGTLQTINTVGYRQAPIRVIICNVDAET